MSLAENDASAKLNVSISMSEAPLIFQIPLNVLKERCPNKHTVLAAVSDDKVVSSSSYHHTEVMSEGKL